jgi:hypothetical protein
MLGNEVTPVHISSEDYFKQFTGKNGDFVETK